MDGLNTKRSYYESGELRSERSNLNGIPNGYHRTWHKNGQLASEIYYKNCVPEGIGRQWDEEGKLVNSFEIKNGTGIEKTWMSEQGIWSETSWLDGNKTGRQRVYWIDDGTVVGDMFWIKGEEVSKKKYQEACMNDRSLPRYDE